MIESSYGKLFSSIVSSTIWREDDKTRLVFITMIAIKNRFGEVAGTIPGLAALANVSLADCESALEKLKSPDKYSRSKEFEGRRIREIDGGWLVLNHAKYRDAMSRDERREYMRNYMASRRAAAATCKQSCKQKGTEVTHTDTEVDTDHKKGRVYSRGRAAEKSEPLAAPPPNHPTMEEAQAHFKKTGGYTATQVRNAFLSLEAGKDDCGNWYWGKRMVGDWRAAIEARMQTLKQEKPKTADAALDRALRDVDRL